MKEKNLEKAIDNEGIIYKLNVKPIIICTIIFIIAGFILNGVEGLLRGLAIMVLFIASIMVEIWDRKVGYRRTRGRIEGDNKWIKI